VVSHGYSMDNVDSASTSDIVVGIIGMGEMGKMYARRLSAAGWR